MTERENKEELEVEKEIYCFPFTDSGPGRRGRKQISEREADDKEGPHVD